MLIESVLYTMTGIVGLATKLSTTAVDLVLGTMSSIVGLVHEILGAFLDVVTNFLGLVNSLLENVAILKRKKMLKWKKEKERLTSDIAIYFW